MSIYADRMTFLTPTVRAITTNGPCRLGIYRLIELYCRSVLLKPGSVFLYIYIHFYLTMCSLNNFCPTGWPVL